MANISKWYEHRRGMAIGIVASGQTLAGIVWPPVFGYAQDTIGWRDAFLWFGVFALAVMVPLCLIVRARPPAPVGSFSGACVHAHRRLCACTQAPVRMHTGACVHAHRRLCACTCLLYTSDAADE